MYAITVTGPVSGPERSPVSSGGGHGGDGRGFGGSVRQGPGPLSPFPTASGPGSAGAGHVAEAELLGIHPGLDEVALATGIESEQPEDRVNHFFNRNNRNAALHK